VVQVVEVTANGIYAMIRGEELAWNKSKDVFFIRVGGKWTKTVPSKFQQSVLKDRHASHVYKAARIANAGNFRKTQNWLDNQDFLSRERNA
jgi:hypothetical protein